MSSISSLALRLAAKRLLTGATLAEDGVHDSSIAPLDHMIKNGGDAAPFIVISSEDESAEITTRDVLTGSRTIDLVIEVAVAHAVTGEGKVGDGSPPIPEIIVPATDAGLEISISLICRQIMRALFETRNPWGDFFKLMVPNVKKITNRRGVGNKEGARFAARQIILTLQTLDDPPFGLDPSTGDGDCWWETFMSLLEHDVELSNLAPLIRSVIEGTEIPDWDQTRSLMGLTDSAAHRLGFAHAAGDASPPPPLTAAELIEND